MNEVQLLEATIKTSIPDSLKAIIIDPPPINIGKNRFLRISDEFEQENTLHQFLTVDEMQAGWLALADDADFAGEQILQFAETLGSPMICIGIGDHNKGQIIVFDYDLYASKVAGSMEEFLAMLY
ncbi:SMI1/KNR4 family protein [Pseudobacter ginsenosidimutans]|uniref:RhsPI domain-containing protein n=1 Tax=Pseudobacter ginsenosidimutans TaxID=661488 RepID=A0A4Q7N4R1_9BACT|nr:SMI1/KNR4 family protein [Pseudobacter ginsenosidimutans]QEC44535.1 SMI1/KNR4 family protein [Pseudobacter ginsenosidimutans]RZS76012.1 hypothetical protein EV199_1888 [Pseudobacter ginsenosidimutans]